MEIDGKRRFDSVSFRDEHGVADAEGFHLHENHRDALHGFPFTVCRIDGRQVAVFIEMDVPPDARADLTPRKPDWLDAVVYARVVSEPRAEIATIDADVPRHGAADLGTCAFATACAAFSCGLFQIVPSEYRVRFEAQGTVRVMMAFDDDTTSWFGESNLSSAAAVNDWRPIVDGFEGNVGSERGIVRWDEEHPDGARITIEEGGVGAPWSITCGVYGLMVHTAFFGSESSAREAAEAMKPRLTEIMDAVGSDHLYELLKRFVADF